MWTRSIMLQFHKQPFADFVHNRCSCNLHNIQRKTPVLEFVYDRCFHHALGTKEKNTVLIWKTWMKFSTINFKIVQNFSVSFCAQLRGRERGLPCLFFKNRKTCPDCAHLWIKFPIQNAVLRVFRRKISKSFPFGVIFCAFFTKPSLLWKIPGCTPYTDKIITLMF